MDEHLLDELTRIREALERISPPPEDNPMPAILDWNDVDPHARAFNAMHELLERPTAVSIDDWKAAQA